MSQRQKLIDSVRNNRKTVRYEDACKIAGWLGFSCKSSGTGHSVFSKPGAEKILNFQNRDGFIVKYQVDQLVAMIDRYEEELK